VVIKEKMELNNDTVATSASNTENDDSDAGLYPRHSGKITLKVHPYTDFRGYKVKNNWSLYERNHGKLSGIIDWKQGVTITLSNFYQWEKLDFYLQNEEKEESLLKVNPRLLEEGSSIHDFSLLRLDAESSYLTFDAGVTINFEADSAKPAIPYPELFEINPLRG
jgi:hypothetical protein